MQHLTGALQEACGARFPDDVNRALRDAASKVAAVPCACARLPEEA